MEMSHKGWQHLQLFSLPFWAALWARGFAF